MENKEASSGGKINYDIIRKKVRNLMLVSKIFGFAGIGLAIVGIGSLFTVTPSTANYSFLLSTLMFSCLVFSISLGLSTQYRLCPPCMNCSQKTEYLYRTNQFHCKRCNKDF